ncbi:hypothetical protein M153_706000889 [Pseudoloma neurophilia]|uniref:Uncharacterized protein n=1 Tax=Pseudoloma neurophilia TaxID=146866 RepID=A0A0R0M2H1_9MICR|nr:hypothetical protein M153_706000889 [Pseudoloma neurophilia]
MAEESNKKDTILGMSFGGFSLIVISISLLIFRFLLTDLSVYWKWWYIGASILLAVIIFATSLFLKGKLSYGVNGLLFLLSMILLFLSWYFASYRIIVFADASEIENYIKTTLEPGKNDKFSIDPFFNKHDNLVVVCVGKQEDKNLQEKDDKNKLQTENIIKIWDDAVQKFKGADQNKATVFQWELNDVNVTSKESAKEFKTALGKIRFTSLFQCGLIKLKPSFGHSFEKGDGMSEEDFKKKFIDPYKKKNE